MDQGQLVPDAVVIGMVEDKIKDHLDDKGFIFDGFPRTVAQAEALDKMLAEHTLSISGMISLDVPEQELRTRIMERGKTSGRTDDQNEEKVTTRIKVYHKETAPVADFYDAQLKLNKVQGVGTIPEIAKKIREVIASF